MSLFRRNKEDDRAQATPMPKAQAEPTKPTSQSESGGGIRQWLIDSYNGLYKVLLEPNMPKWSTTFVLIIGIIIGMFWAYLVVPIQWAGGNPNRLNQSAQDQWIKMAAVGYDQQSFYDADQVRILLNQVSDPIASIQRLLSTEQPGTADYNALVALQNAVAGAQVAGTPAPVAPGLGEQAVQLVVPIIVIALVFIILTLLWRLLIYPNLVQPLQDRIRMARDAEYAQQRRVQQAALKTMQEQRRLAEQLKSTAQDDAELGAPIMQSLSIFKRNVPYDDSKEIERKIVGGGSEFLGQCGAVIAEAVYPDPVAIEVWVFDMATQQDAKKVFITPQANGDGSIRARVGAELDDPNSEIVVAQPGQTLLIDTNSLRLKAILANVEIGVDGRFENAQIQLQAWSKNGSTLPAVTPTPTMTAAPIMPPPQPVQSVPPAYNPPPQPQPYPSATAFNAPPPQPASPPAWEPPTPATSSPASLGSLLDGDTAPIPPQPFGGVDPLEQRPRFAQSNPFQSAPSSLQYPPGMDLEDEDDYDDDYVDDFDDDDDPFGDTGNFRPTMS
ncbi:MAG: hypothetical protein KC615_22760 [Anaerolineae bacterium]|nr:hypothetical protein [Anaerolineae bacterium]